MIRLLARSLTWMFVSSVAFASSLSVEQKEVQALIKSLYGVPAKTFEVGNFDGRYDPEKVKSVYFARFFSEQIVSTIKNPSHVEGGGFIRHPALDGEDINGFGSEEPSRNPKILPAVLSSNGVYVDVYPDRSGRTIYFLKKTNAGWRIINTASYNVWPVRNDGTCWEPFYLIKPTPEQLSLETEECIKYRRSQPLKK